jgi:hypothetical protein
MGKRFAIVIGAAALGAAVIAVGASADFTSVHDPRGDTKCGHESGGHKPCSDYKRRNADIVRATAGHEGGRLKHTIRVVGKLHQGQLLINTDSDPECEWAFGGLRSGGGSEVQECGDPLHRTGRVRYDFHLHSVEIFFSKRSIGFPRRGYGWSASAGTFLGPAHASDQVPSEGYIRHRLR